MFYILITIDKHNSNVHQAAGTRRMHGTDGRGARHVY
jgi:hypothetical protein